VFADPIEEGAEQNSLAASVEATLRRLNPLIEEANWDRASPARQETEKNRGPGQGAD
jgi:hypothetical protein